MARPRRSFCPISFALNTFGDKWSLLILRDLIFKDKSYYEDFLQSEEKIATNILAERLKRLKEEGFIRSEPDKDNKRKIVYSPTTKALDLIPMILEMIEWSANYDRKTAAPEKFVKMIKKDRKRLAKQIRAKFEK